MIYIVQNISKYEYLHQHLTIYHRISIATSQEVIIICTVENERRLRNSKPRHQLVPVINRKTCKVPSPLSAALKPITAITCTNKQTDKQTNCTTQVDQTIFHNYNGNVQATGGRELNPLPNFQSPHAFYIFRSNAVN